MRQRIVSGAVSLEFWLISLLFWLLLSACRSLGTPWMPVALTEALRWSAGIGLALALGNWLHGLKKARQCVVALAGVLALTGIGAGLQSEHGGLTGPYGEHQLYGSVLLLLLPLCVAMALTSRHDLWRLGAIAASGAGFFCLLLSQTRSAWAGALVAALVFGGLWLSRSPLSPRCRRNWGASVVAVLTGLLALWLFTTPSDLRAPLTARVGTLFALQKDDSWQERLTLWQGASRLVEAHPLTGIGLGRYPGTQWAWTGKGRPLLASECPSLSEEAHDFYLQTAAEIGLVGLGLYGAALLAFVFQAMQRLRQRQPRRSQNVMVMAALSMLAGQAVDALASPSWQLAEASLFFWALLGLGIASVRREHSEVVPPTVSILPRRIGQWALSGAVAVSLTANVLPIGLLAPVEAYTPPTGTTFKSAVVTGSTQNAKAGDVVYFTMVATYKDSSHTYTQNVSNESTTNFFATIPPGTMPYGTFTQDAANHRVQYIVPNNVKAKTLTINGTFKNGFITAQTTQNASLAVSP